MLSVWRMSRYDRPVSSIMTTQVVTCAHNATLSEGLVELQKSGANALIVTNRLGGPEGVVSLSDLVPHGSVSLDDGWRVVMVLGGGTVATIMKGPVVSIPSTASVRDAAEVMLNRGIHQVFVVDGDELKGAVGARDLMRAAYAERDRARLVELMSTPVETVSIGDSIDEAIVRLEATNVHALIVVDEGYPVGIFSRMEALFARGLPELIRSTPVEQIMNQSILCFDEGTKLYRAAGSMAVVNAKRILVVSGNQLRGIITGPDLARWILA